MCGNKLLCGYSAKYYNGREWLTGSTPAAIVWAVADTLGVAGNRY